MFSLSNPSSCLSPIRLAIQRKSYQDIITFLDMGYTMSLSDINDEDLSTFGELDEVHVAALTGDISSLIRELNKNRQALNYANKRGFTPVYFAVMNNQKKVFEILLSANADVCHITKQRENLLHWAVRKKDVFFCDKILPRIPANFIQQRNQSGFTPLHFACAKGNYAVAKLLLAKGAKPDIENIYGATPLHWAASITCDSQQSSVNKAKVIQVLQKSLSKEAFAANIAKKNRLGYTPLHWMIISGDAMGLSSLTNNCQGYSIIKGEYAALEQLAKKHISKKSNKLNKILNFIDLARNKR